MKKIILIMVLFLPCITYSQAGFWGFSLHDSLLFDADGIVNSGITGDICPRDNECVIKVWSVTGSVIGTVVRDTIIPAGCLDWDTAWVCERRQLMIGDRVKPGKEVETGTDGYVELRVSKTKGTYIRTSQSVEGVAKTDRITAGPSSRIEPGCITILKQGKVLFYDVKDEAGKMINEGIEKGVESVKSVFKPKGTKFSIEITSDEEILRVYEGSVEAKLKKYDGSDMENSAKEYMQLQEDYNNGKISQQEYIEKAKKYAESINKDALNVKTVVTVDEGNQVSMGKKIGDVKPIENDDRWFDNFK